MRTFCSVILVAAVLWANSSAAGRAESEAPTKPASVSGLAKKKDVVKVSRAKLGPDYKKIASFADFRKKLIADGWQPVINPNCREVVLGADYQDRCGKSQSDIECRVCELVPELFRSTSDGYSVMHYVKNGTPLSVTVYGDMRELDEPGRYAGGFVVLGWEYTSSINVIPLD